MAYLPSKLRQEAQDAARALTEAGVKASAYELADDMYVVEWGPEGRDTAYTIDNARRRARGEERLGLAVFDVRVTVAYFMATGRMLTDGSEVPALLPEQFEVLEYARLYRHG